jgi:hypothetical protein
MSALLTTMGRELARYKLGSVDVREVRWHTAGALKSR